MTPGLRELLHQAVGDAPSTPGPEDIRQRGRRQRRNLVLLQSGAVATGLAVLASVLFLPRTEAGRVRTVAPVDRPSPGAASPGPDAAGGAPGPAPGPPHRSTPPKAVAAPLPASPSARLNPVAPTAPATRVNARLYFLSNSALVWTRADGSDRHVVMQNAPRPWGAWPGTAKLLMDFHGSDSSGSLSIFDPDTLTQQVLVRHSSDDFQAASASPDGSHVVYQASTPPGPLFVPGGNAFIYVLNLADGTETQLIGGQDPQWSPLGDRILVSTCKDGSNQFAYCTIKPDGSDIRSLGTYPLSGSLTWSPDGQWLAGSNNSMLSIARLDGSGLRPIGHGSGDTRPAWTADGTHVAYQRVDFNNGGNNNTAGIAVAAVDGSTDVLITHNTQDLNPIITPD